MQSRRLSFYEKFSYALGDTASNLYFQFFSIFIVYYYTDVYGLDPLRRRIQRRDRTGYVRQATGKAARR